MEKVKHATIHDFRKKYGTDAACLRALLHFRTSSDGLCFNPSCKSSIEKYYRPLRNRKAFLCKRCLGHFYPMAGSIFENTHISISDWFLCIFKMLISRNGISAKELHREFGYSYKSIFRMLHQVRELMGECLNFEFESTVVEIDESYVSTGNRGYGRHYPFKRGRGSLKTTSVLGIVERGGKTKLIVIPDTTAKTILPQIIKHVSKDTTIFTDSWQAYSQLKELGYNHAKVNHSKYEFVDRNTGASTNAAENTFMNLKRAVRGTWRKVSEQKLQNYLNEASFRATYVDKADYGFEILMRQLSSLSATYDSKKAA